MHPFTSQTRCLAQLVSIPCQPLAHLPTSPAQPSSVNLWLSLLATSLSPKLFTSITYSCLQVKWPVSTTSLSSVEWLVTTFPPYFQPSPQYMHFFWPNSLHPSQLTFTSQDKVASTLPRCKSPDSWGLGSLFLVQALFRFIPSEQQPCVTTAGIVHLGCKPEL